MNTPIAEVADYYSDPHVRERLNEFFGGATPRSCSAVFFSPGTCQRSFYFEQHPLEELEDWLKEGAELNRSLWDREALLAHLDVEYVNFDSPAAVYADPDRAFALQRPVQEAAMRVLGAHGIKPLHVLTGRGHHFSWMIRQDSPAFERLAGLGRMSESLRHLYASSPAPGGETVATRLGAAFSGLGLVIEFLAHAIKAEAGPLMQIPLEMAAVEGCRQEPGREVIALDITEYADPLIARSVRVPFSVYLKPWQNHHAPPDEMKPLISIPGDGLEGHEALRLMRDSRAVRKLAAESSTIIPDCSREMESLVAAYEASRLREFHQWYYSVEHDPRESWPGTYDCTAHDTLPPEVRAMLLQPNDALLRPGCVKLFVGVMLSLGWHPRHIAGLILSKYERDHDWGRQWHHCDPATRADFYARLFTGLLVCGLDDLLEAGPSGAADDWLPYMKSLLERKKYERLASRPLHGLFLPEKDL